MESLSRPPHRRKHSTSTNIFSSSFSFKNPYDDVLLSNGGEAKSLEPHEYSEIFSGSSSIPVLDLPGLDQRLGSDDFPKSKHDYSNIFGGFSNDDVLVSYEKLLNASAKKTKPPIPAETQPCLHESGSLHSARKTKSTSVEASDQSVDEVKQHFNMSFNKTNQKNGDALGGKTHIAELQAVPGFTHLVDGNPRLNKMKNDKLPSLKREVSRTWSFSAEMEPAKNKGGSSCVTSQLRDKSHSVNEVNLKSQFSKPPPPSNCSSNLSGNNDPRQSKVSSDFSSKDFSQKIAGECSPPFFGEEFDENSADAVSAAALKKAIEQAQESIRIAKMIMERRKEVFQDGSMPRPIGGQKCFDKEVKIEHEAYSSKDNNVKGKHEELDHIFTLLNEIDGKFTPSLSQNDTLINAANSEVERVCENVDADEEHAEAFAGKSKLFASNCSQSEMLRVDDTVTLGKPEKNVEAVDTPREGNGFPGLVSNTKGSEVVTELVERAFDTSQRMQGMEKSVEEDELCQDTSDHAKGPESTLERAFSKSEMMEDGLSRDTFVHENGPENLVEGVLHKSQKTAEHYKVLDEAGENLSISQEGEVNKERENDAIDKEKHEKKLEEHKERLNEENLVLRSEFYNVLNESSEPVGNESLEQEETEKRSAEFSKWKGNGQHGQISDEEISETLQKESQEPEFDDKKQLRVDDGNEPKLAEELMQNKVEEEHVNTCESEAAGTIKLEADHFQKRGSFWDIEETDNAHGGAGESEGAHCKYEFQEATAYVGDVDEAVELSSSDASTIFDEAHTNDTSSDIGETKEACNVDLNNQVEEHWKIVKNYKENDTVLEVNETVSADDKVKKAELFFLLQDDEILGTNSLRRSASEEFFDENKLPNPSAGLSFDGKVETVGVMNADPEANLPVDVSNINSNIHDDISEDLASDIRTVEFDFIDVREALGQASESDEGSVSASSSEKIDGLSANESEECAPNEKDMTSDKEELEDELEMISDEIKCSEELSEGLYSHLQSEHKEMDKPKETERVVEEGLTMEPNQENLAVTSSIEGRDAKESVQHFESNDQQQRIEAIKKGREREKNRIAVERAIREARERAFAEARERAERAAVERAAAEARQRVMAEAREKVEKPYVVKQPVDKISTEAKLRAERAAVERATAEARERALEKAMSQKFSTESRTPADRHPTERGSSSSGNNGLKHSFSSSDLETGTITESAQRRKAKLERHQRIMERAAKALAEKNMRDLLAQKEQAERNRLAESLDADIKRWATGKEGNLRALLSTLQYILGTDGGWQPISLTEIITTAAVKKAYRKATLYVHPDKLQQRGASVQQKYICEKVFDLLKAAWNRFNSDER